MQIVLFLFEALRLHWDLEARFKKKSVYLSLAKYFNKFYDFSMSANVDFVKPVYQKKDFATHF